MSGPFSYVAAICLRLLVIAVVFLSTGNASEPVSASVGQTVILPCKIELDGDLPTIEWSKDGSGIVFLYRHGCETFEMKTKDFEYRTSLIMNELPKGNMSLRIAALRLSDSGTYWCKILWPDKDELASTVELVVGAVSEPKLEFVPSNGDEVTLQCKAGCWFPEPLVTFLNDQGEEMDAKNQQRSQDLENCSTITRNVTLKTATNRVCCRVHQPETNLTRITEMYIPAAFMRSCTISTAIASIVSLVIVLGLLGTALLVHKYVCKVRGQKMSLQPEEVVTCSNQPRDVGQAVVQNETEDQRSDEDVHPPEGVHDRLSTQTPAEQHQSTRDSGSSPDIDPHNHPKSDDLPKTRNLKLADQRPNSTPALIDDVAALSSISDASGVFRSKSVSESRHALSRDKLKRRPSLTNMPIGYKLSDLKEEVECLISEKRED